MSLNFCTAVMLALSMSEKAVYEDVLEKVLWLLASKQPQNLYDIHLMLYVES